MTDAKPESLSKKFVPQFWSQVDGRMGLAREIKKRVDALREDCAADSVQKDYLVQRAAFLGIQIETMENVAAKTGKLEAGTYGQLTNTLLGVLKALGLERKVKAGDLKSHLDKKAKAHRFVEEDD